MPVNPSLEQPLGICRAGNLTLDLIAHTAFCGSRHLDFTRREYDLMTWLMTHPDLSFTREQLLNAVWGNHFEGSDRSVDLCILRLRHRLEKAGWSGAHLDTVWGSGYRMTLIPAEQP